MEPLIRKQDIGRTLEEEVRRESQWTPGRVPMEETLRDGL